MCTVFKRIQSGIKQLTMFINLCCFKCFPASFFSLTANTYLQLSFELTPPACHSSDPSSPPPPPFSEVLPSPSSQLCRWRRQSGTRTEESGGESWVCSPNSHTDWKEWPGQRLFFSDSREFSKINLKRSLVALYCLVGNPFLWFFLLGSGFTLYVKCGLAVKPGCLEDSWWFNR